MWGQVGNLPHGSLHGLGSTRLGRRSARGGPLLDFFHRHEPIFVLLLSGLKVCNQPFHSAAALLPDASPDFVNLVDDWVVSHSKSPRYCANSDSGVTITGIGRQIRPYGPGRLHEI